jgi:hypothetical protein
MKSGAMKRDEKGRLLRHGCLDMIKEIMLPVHGLQSERLDANGEVRLLLDYFLFANLQEPACRVF